MKRPDVNLVLDEALCKLRAGAPLDQVLAECGEYAAELAPLLEAAGWMQPSAGPAVPHGAMARSRARFLQAAEARSAKAVPFFTNFRWAVNLAVILAVLAAALFFTGLGSVSALPGQALYPVKRAVEQARLALAASDPAGKLLLEESFDERRVDETLRLAELGRGEQVNFAGFLSGGGTQPWTVDGIVLELDDPLSAAAEGLIGAYVEVQGRVQDSGVVLVSLLRLRFFELEGQLSQRDGDRWLVSGVWVAITDQTRVEQPPAAGQDVEMTAIRLSQQDFLALSVRLEDGDDDSGSQDDDLSSPAGSSTDDGGDDDPDETPEPGETDDGGGEDDLDETPEIGGTDDGGSDDDDGTPDDSGETPDSDSGGDDNETPESGGDPDDDSGTETPDVDDDPDDDSGGD